MQIARFASLTKSSIVRQDLTRTDFITHLTTHKRLDRKDSAPLFSPTEYHLEARERRANAVVAVTSLVFDIERKAPSPLQPSDIDALRARLAASGFEYVLASTHNHRPEDQRFRLVLFPDRDVTPTEFSEVRRRLCARLELNGYVDTAAEDIARIFFWPTCPPGATPFAEHVKGQDVDLEDLLSGYVAVPYERLNHIPPPNYKYVAPVAPTNINLKPFHEIMDAYRGRGEDPQDKVRKTQVMQAIRMGRPYPVKDSYNFAMWSAVSLLVYNLPSGTSAEEIAAVLQPTLHTMYGTGEKSITFAEAMDVALRQAERAIQTRAEAEAGEEWWQASLEESAKQYQDRLSKMDGVIPETMEELAEADEVAAGMPSVLQHIVYNIPEERFYYRSSVSQSFDLGKPVGKDGITARLRTMKVPEGMIKQTLKLGLYPKANGIEFEPRHTALFQKGGELYINSWKRPDIVPAQGDYPSIHKILDSLLWDSLGKPGAVDEEGKEWLLHWLAWCVQNPSGVPGVAVLLNGKATGTGKNTLAHVMMRIFGEDNCAKVTSRQLEGRFTSGWIEKCFVFGDEIYSAEHKNEVTDLLKDLVTGQTVISEAKGVNGRVIPNRAKFLFASNNELPIKLDSSDRRFTVFTRHEDITAEYRQFTQSLFTPENKSTKAFDAEIAAFAWDLERRVVDVQAIKVPYPNTSRENLVEAAIQNTTNFFEYVDAHGIDDLIRDAVGMTANFILDNWREQAGRLWGVDWDHGPSKGVSQMAVFSAYRAYCKRIGEPSPKKYGPFGGALKAHRPTWQCKHPLSKKLDGTQAKVWTVKRNEPSANKVIPLAQVPGQVEAQA